MSLARNFYCFLLLCLVFEFVTSQNYEVADIDCIFNHGRELLTARLRKPEGFRGNPIFADEQQHHQSSSSPLALSSSTFKSTPMTTSSSTAANSYLLPSSSSASISSIINELENNNNAAVIDPPCQIFRDPTDASGRVYILRVSDFSQCGVIQKNDFIHVRVWFPQLPGVVMLSDQEVIIMCKPPSQTVTQSKTAGFAGSIPSGARVSGIVEESPGRLEYEVALFRETSNSGGGGGGSVGSNTGGRSVSENNAFITGVNSHELPVDQAVPIGTKLQLRAKISSDSVWQHAKLMEVSVSPDPKNPTADGSVALVKNGCRNAELISIIPKQPYRFKERTNEVVLDFEAFLLSNMGERNTLWLHTQIKACMEVEDCTPEFCLDVYQPSGFGRRRRKKRTLTIPVGQTNAGSPQTFDYVNPLSQHWETILDNHLRSVQGNNNNSTQTQSSKVNKSHKVNSAAAADGEGSEAGAGSGSTKFDENIGFSVMMPADYYRSIQISNSSSAECRGWILGSIGSWTIMVILGLLGCIYQMKKGKNGKVVEYYETRPTQPTSTPKPCFSSPIVMTIQPQLSEQLSQRDEYEALGLTSSISQCSSTPGTSRASASAQQHHHHHHHHKRGSKNLQSKYSKDNSSSSCSASAYQRS